jgi:hypothetical protein
MNINTNTLSYFWVAFEDVRAKARFEEASEILGYDLLKVVLDGPPEALNQTVSDAMLCDAMT